MSNPMWQEGWMETWIAEAGERHEKKVEKIKSNLMDWGARVKVLNRHKKCGTVLVASGTGGRSHLLSVLHKDHGVTACGILATSLRTVEYTTNLCPACWLYYRAHGGALRELKTKIILGKPRELNRSGTRQLNLYKQAGVK